ncbi:glycosyltransferase family 4 protein [Kamptonema sp. UHCC 0994]|uniref:glycosyltransferase family 4 protein n=1 Tax=Kamptonema sp. UHCC 0994 TaxID=3031329 RepID=UPI0023B989B0|nr:glycosyltransferase family 4 protein [Kamptonema sp. UHCC 0994]MDF0552052.1 glycosyltransferase family 4 protein [Kamptonema sp. UHCC 0994]
MMFNNANFNFGVNIIGHVSGEFGLGGGVRGTIKAIEAANIPFTIRDLKEDSQRNLDSTYTNFSSKPSYPINIVHTNPHESLLNSIDTEFFKDRYNIGFWIWELPVFPDIWMGAFNRFDEVWTYSNYTAETISDVSPLPVVKLPPSIYLPPNTLDREALGLPKDKFIFLFMFDMGSGFERKNPFATIEAFKKAFDKSNQDVLLIIKFRPHPAYQNQYQELKSMTEDWPSIQFIEGHLSKEEVHGLVDNCNCYVSLHRAEGFGLTMAEAMYYGKPVIATAYSSNTDFMNVGNSFLVRYELIATTEAYGLYPKGSIWAEPDIDHASYLMQYVFQNYSEAQEVGVRGAKEIRSLFDPEVIGKKIRHRLEYIGRTIEEKNFFESQAQAWKKSALQSQRELDRLKFKV